MLGKQTLIMMLAAFCAASAQTADAAEQAVGLEAQGVDPWASLHNPLGFDVRDELGRPVSARLVERQIKAAAAKAAAAATFASGLPQARSVVLLLELLAGIKISWKTGPPLFPLPQSWALAPKPRSNQKIPLSAILMIFNAGLSCAVLLKICRPSCLSAAKPSVLRC